MLEIICEKAFINTSINYIFIPSNVKKIGESAFEGCTKLKLFEIQENSKLKSLQKNLFLGSSVESISIPSHLKLIEGWCNETPNLKKVEILDNIEKNIYNYYDKYILGKSEFSPFSEFDILLFARRDIEKAEIPSFIKMINAYAFNYCQKLQEVKIPEDSELQIIERFAFSYAFALTRNKGSLNIPKNLKHIFDYAFSKRIRLIIIINSLK